MLTGDTFFRQIENRICFIYSEGLENEYEIMLNDFADKEKANGFLAFSYVDHKDGILFDVLCNAFIDSDGNVTAFGGNDENFLRIRKLAFANQEIVILDVTSEYYDVFEYKINTTMSQAKSRSNQVADYVRTMNFIDGSRDEYCPDDLAVLFMADDKEPEVIWCRIEGMDGHKLQGVVLTEPAQAFGVKQGDMISFGIAEYMGAPTCVYVAE